MYRLHPDPDMLLFLRYSCESSLLGISVFVPFHVFVPCRVFVPFRGSVPVHVFVPFHVLFWFGFLFRFVFGGCRRERESPSLSSRLSCHRSSHPSVRSRYFVISARRDEEEARALVTAAKEKLQEIIEERDMHREKALTLEQALEAARKCRETASIAVAADIPASSVVEENAAVEEALTKREDEDADMSMGASVLTLAEETPPLAAVSDTRVVTRSNVDHVAGTECLTVAPSLLIAIGDPSGHARNSGLSPSSEISESETDAEVDDDVINDDVINDYASDGVQKGVDLAITLQGIDERNASLGNGNPRGGISHKDSVSSSPRQPLLSLGEDVNVFEITPQNDESFDDLVAPSEAAVQSSWGRPVYEANAPYERGGSSGHGLLDVRGKLSSRGTDDSDEDIEALAQEKKLAAWLSRLEIRRQDAMRYASNLVADGFDSGEVLMSVGYCFRQTSVRVESQSPWMPLMPLAFYGGITMNLLLLFAV